MDELLIYLVYLCYGLAFFTVGVSITSKDTRNSKVVIARILWLFAAFAFSHALHEWIELYLIPHFPSGPGSLIAAILWVKLAVLAVSFSFLAQFGVRLMRIVWPEGRRLLSLAFPAALVIWGLVVIVHGVNSDRQFFAFADIRLRNLLGFPGAALAGSGLIFFSRDLPALHSKGAANFKGAGAWLLTYGVLTGLIPSDSTQIGAGVPIVLLRAAVTFCVLRCLSRAFDIFDEEEREVIEERLHRFAQTEKLTAIGKLAAGIAHEVNNPLTNVSLSVEMLKEALGTDGLGEEYAKRIESIERNIDRASRIARELLHFSREKEAEFVPTDISEVVMSSVTLLGPRKEHVAIHTKLNEVPTINGIPWKLEEVLLNVMINALESMPNGGELTIKNYAEGDTVFVQIKDTGAGIPPENLDLIFDPFFTSKAVGEGTGLGLSVCYGIMEMHGGRIEVESSPGQGTTVTLIFQAGENNDE